MPDTNIRIILTTDTIKSQTFNLEMLYGAEASFNINSIIEKVNSKCIYYKIIDYKTNISNIIYTIEDTEPLSLDKSNILSIVSPVALDNIGNICLKYRIIEGNKRVTKFVKTNQLDFAIVLLNPLMFDIDCYNDLYSFFIVPYTIAMLSVIENKYIDLNVVSQLTDIYTKQIDRFYKRAKSI